MMEILPETLSGAPRAVRERKSWHRKKTLSFDIGAEDFVEDLIRVRKNLLLKTNKNISRFTIGRRNSFLLTDDQLKSIYSMLPDEIIHHACNYELRKFEAAVFFADISGFTDLSEKYRSFENGASKLSMVLNFYLGSMVQEILSHGGDIIKYAGDAFLAIFRAESEENLQDAVHHAIDSAVIIQKNCSNYHADIANVTLNVKIAISAGEVYFSPIGNETSSHYAIVGDPVWQVKSLQENIKPGEILVTSKAWFYSQETHYTFEHIKDLKHYKVIGFKDELENVQRHHEATLLFYSMKKELEEVTDASSYSLTVAGSSINPYTMNDMSDQREHFSLRQSINLKLDLQSKNFLRRFIITPVLKSIDMNEPIELLTEMRHVVIVFANFIVLRSSSEELLKVTDSIYNNMNDIVTHHEGILNKVSLFDKDMMFLIIFGLRGFKHVLESRKGLRCASDILREFKSWPEIATVSIGVTSGMSYCGVVGHTLRREYSVISVTVNKAARLMIAYPGIVSCDQETLLYSKMDIKNFTLLPKKSLKGLNEQVFAYEFIEIIRLMEVNEPITYKYPLLGRSEILELAKQLLDDASNMIGESSDGYDFNAEIHRISCLVIKDFSQLGKTRVLEEIFHKCHQNEMHCLRLSLAMQFSKVPYVVMRKIMVKVLDFPSSLSSASLSEIIETKLQKFNVNDTLCVFNSILNTNFAKTEILKQLNEEELLKVQKLMLKLLLSQTFEFFCVLIDDIEFLDKESFELLECVFESNKIFSIFTLGQQRKLSDKQLKTLQSDCVLWHRLEPLDVMYENELACQFLNVSALSLELESYLHKNSGGNPGWIETCTKSLLQSNKLEIISMSIRDSVQRGMTFGDHEAANDTDVIETKRSMFSQCYRNCQTKLHCQKDESNFDEVVQVAVLNTNHLQSEIFMSTKADRDLMIYDALSSYDQLVCKCASVIGIEFSRQMLFYVMSSSTDRMIGQAMVKLFELSIFACASAVTGNQEEQIKQKKSSDHIVCNCKELVVFDSCRDLSRYACCTSMKFQREGFCSVVYNSLTDKQRLEYHRRSMVYLHMETKKCNSCGNGHFTELMFQDFDFKFHDGVVDQKDSSYQSMVEYFESISLTVESVSKTSLIERMKSQFTNKKLRKIFPVVLNYITYDFHYCTCNMILYLMYNDMIKHCYGAGMTLKGIESKIQLANMCIKISNIPRATKLLTNTMRELESTQLNDESCYLDYLRGRALSLQSICSSYLMQNQKALELCYKACKTFDVSFPKTFSLMARYKLQKLIKSIKKSVVLQESPKRSRLFSLVATQLAKTLSFMFELQFERKQFDLAKLAAFWSLEKMLKCERNFSNVARCFGNVLKIIFYTGSIDEFLWLQKAALEQVARTLFADDVNLKGLTNLIKLYKWIMMCQITRKEIRAAIEIGEISKRLCSKVQLNSLQTEIVPSLFLLLVNSKQLPNAHALLQTFETTIRSMNDKNGLIWYYALCMDMLLDTGFTVVSYEDCDQFFLNEITTFHKESLPEARCRFLANLLLWCVRHEIYEMAQIWMENLSLCLAIEPQSSINNAFTGLRVMEVLTLQLTYAIQNRNLTLYTHIKDESMRLMKLMSSVMKITKCFEDRFVLHQTHFAMVKKYDEKHLKTLEKLLSIAQKNKNFCSFDIIKHTLRCWRRELTSDAENFWINHSSKGRELNLFKVGLFDRVFPYSLPIPRSGNF